MISRLFDKLLYKLGYVKAINIKIENRNISDTFLISNGDFYYFQSWLDCTEEFFNSDKHLIINRLKSKLIQDLPDDMFNLYVYKDSKYLYQGVLQVKGELIVLKGKMIDMDIKDQKLLKDK